MTDERFDALLKDTLAPEEEAPELQLPLPLKPRKKRVWVGYLAACLCFMVCTGVALRFLPQKKAAPETACGTSAPESDNNFSSEFMDTADPEQAPTAPSATLTKREVDAIVSIAETYLGERPACYAVLGRTERYLSVRAESSRGNVTLTLDRENCTEVTLNQLLQDYALPSTTAKYFYFNQQGELILE